MILSKCTACDSEKPSFMKEQEAIGLLWSWEMKTPLKKLPLLGDFIF